MGLRSISELITQRIMKAVAFDLGDTLVEYEGFPPSWEAHYDSAIRSLAGFIGVTVSGDQISAANEVLRRYNTRLHPRIKEVEFGTILSDLLRAMGAEYAGHADDAAAAFFCVFRQRLRCFPDTEPRLNALRRSGVRIGVLTDVPYGMPFRLVREDMKVSGVLGLIDVIVTSVDAGVRKPDCGGLQLLASRLQCSASEMIFVGNEKKEMEAAVAFGCEAVLLDRKLAVPDWKQHRAISTLAEL
jgi:putative hydrolase of the HAD superfamily